MKYPITISEIKVTERTARLTGLSTVEEIIAAKKTLFSKLSDVQQFNLLEDLYNGKLKASDKQILKEMSSEERRMHAIDSLSFQVGLTQEVPRKAGEQAASRINAVSFFLSTRLNVSNQTSLKYFWQTITLDKIEQYGYAVKADFTKIMQDNGIFAHILRTTTFEPEVNKEGLITSTPKRAGKGGDILTLDGKLLFTSTELILEEFESLEEFEESSEHLIAEELENAEKYKHDDIIDAVLNPIPAEIRQKDGTFNAEYQQWLHSQVMQGLGAQVAIKDLVAA